MCTSLAPAPRTISTERSAALLQDIPASPGVHVAE